MKSAPPFRPKRPVNPIAEDLVDRFLPQSDALLPRSQQVPIAQAETIDVIAVDVVDAINAFLANRHELRKITHEK
jgi:hypothetical protein